MPRALPIAKEQQTDAGCAQPGNLRDLAMGRALGISEPQQLAFSGLHLRQGRAKNGLGIDAVGIAYLGRGKFRKIVEGGHHRTAPVITQKITGNAEEIAPSGLFVLAAVRSAQEPKKTFLKQIISQASAAGDARQVSPE